MPAPPPGYRIGRYSFDRVHDTLVRLDRRTGQVSVCSQGAGGWACQAVPDDRTALESEIGRLLAENAGLKKQLAARNAPRTGDLKQPVPPARPPAATPQPRPDKAPDVGPETRLPSDADFERAMTFLTKAWRRMVEMMADLQRDMRRKN
jgi:hypothetical protein